MTTQRDRTQGFLLIALATLLLTLAAAFAFSGATADPASAQSPAICDEYPAIPQCEAAGGGGGNPNDGAPGAIPGGGDAGPNASAVATAKGELPFTGYPLTPLLLLLLLLLVTGLTIRAYVAVRDRVRARDSDTPSGNA